MSSPPPSTFDTFSTSPSDNDFNSSDSPSSFTPPYRTLSTLPSSVAASSLPQGLPILGPLTGYTQIRRVHIINDRLHTLSATAKRPLTAEEESAIAFYTAKGLSIGSWGPSIGVAFGLLRWWRTWNEMRWLWLGRLRDDTIYAKPGENVSPNGPTSGSAASGAAGTNPTSTIESSANASSSSSSTNNPNEPNTSQNPRRPNAEPRTLRWDGSRLWAGQRELLSSWDPLRRSAVLQGVRALPYIGLGWILSSLFIGTYAGSVAVVGEIQDPRLKSLLAQVRKAVEARQGVIHRADQEGSRVSGRGPESTQGTVPMDQRQQQFDRDPRETEREKRDVFGQGTRTPGQLWRGHRQAIEGVPSPSSASSPDDSDPFVADSDADMNSGRTQSRSSWRRGSGRNQESSSSVYGSGSSYDGEADNDSPTGGRGVFSDLDSSQFSSSYDENPDASATVSGGTGGGRGGSWDRIRARAAARSSSPSEDPDSYNRNRIRGGQVRGDGGSDDFAFSKSEEERQLAQEEAQKDFDARIERERRGGDFNSAGGVRKW